MCSSPVPSPIAACWCIASTVRRSRWSRSPTRRRIWAGRGCPSAFARAWEHTAEVELPSPFPNCCMLVYRFDGASFTLVEVADPAAHLGGEGLPI